MVDDSARSAESVRTFGSLFSGIGGIDLGLERAEWTCRWQAEIDPYASKVLAKHWPHVPNLGDVREIDWENDGLDYGDGIARSLHVDLVAGGFPCQPVSQAGRRLAQLDDRWLWPEFERCVRSLRPRHVLVENVPGLLVRGMGDVLGDLAGLGYDCEWESVPAAAVGAPHLRWRVFVVAHAVSEPVRVRSGGVDGSAGTREGEAPERERVRVDVVDGRAGAGVAGAVGNTDGAGFEEQRRSRPVHQGRFVRWQQPQQSSWWSSEPDVGRMVDGLPFRVDRLRCLGNAVVPQVAEYVGRMIPVGKEREGAPARLALNGAPTHSDGDAQQESAKP